MWVWVFFSVVRWVLLYIGLGWLILNCGLLIWLVFCVVSVLSILLSLVMLWIFRLIVLLVW